MTEYKIIFCMVCVGLLILSIFVVLLGLMGKMT